MKKNILFLIAVILIIISVLSGCENMSQTTYEDSNVKGFIVDSLTRNPLDSVTLNIPDIPLSVTDYPSGYYQFLNIHMPRPTWGVSLVATRNGYASRTFSVLLMKADTAFVNFSMLHN
jgi:hypothetical protein